MYPVSRTGAYDRAITVFSPDGRLYQVEYATKIIEKGTPGVGIIYSDGVLLGADKRVLSNLILPESIEKIFQIDDHMGAVSSGLVGDARRLIQLAREKCQENKMRYDEPLQVEIVTKEIAGITQLFTQHGGMRPFGVSFIIGGVDRGQPRLFETEPSGALAEYHAVAIGRNKQEIMKLLEKEYKPNMSYDEAIKLMIKALARGLEKDEALEARRLDFAVLAKDKAFRRVAPEEIERYLKKESKTKQ